MKQYHVFYKTDEDNNQKFVTGKKVKNGRVNVPIFSDFFGNFSNSLFCTNAQYSEFKNTIISSIEVYNAKTAITLDVYETKESDPLNREMLCLGFRKYLFSLRRKLAKQFLRQLISVILFAIFGIGLILLSFYFESSLSEWLMYLVSNIGTVLLWQLVGYFAFEFAGRRREINRIKQLERLEYIFKLWN